MLNKNERIEMLEDAQEKINEAIDLITNAVCGTNLAATVSAYTVAHLTNWANGENPYDDHIPNLIESIRKSKK